MNKKVIKSIDKIKIGIKIFIINKVEDICKRLKFK